jgi:hypothetical protein
VAASHPRVQLHVTPTDSSWLNLVERFIAELTTQVAAPQEPSQRPGVGAVDPPLGRHLECQSAAVGVTKTADEILDTIATYCRHINNSGHQFRRHQTDLACSWWIPRRSKRIQEGSRRIVRMIRRMIRGTSDRGSETRQANHPSRPGLPAGRDGGVAGDESTCSPASAGAHRSASNCMDCSWSAAFACCFHRSWSMPTTRSHRHSAPSPMRAGSWIQGTSWAAAPGARMSVKL